MEAIELRIGNWVKLKDGQGGVIVCNIDELSIWTKSKLNTYRTFSLEKYCGIPLTKEILLECGFDADYKNGYIGINVNFTNFTLTYPCVLGEWQKSFAYEYGTFNLPRFRELRYLHELQNLFFALTNQELDCSFLESNKNQNNEESNSNK